MYKEYWRVNKTEASKQLKKMIKGRIKELLELYKQEGYIDDDTTAYILYNDGLILTYPDDVEKIKLKNVKNIHIMDGFDNMDFYYSVIRIAYEEFGDNMDDIINEELNRYQTEDFKPVSILVLDDEDEYYTKFFEQ